jgi:hypothetical protein
MEMLRLHISATALHRPKLRPGLMLPFANASLFSDGSHEEIRQHPQSFALRRKVNIRKSELNATCSSPARSPSHHNLSSTRDPHFVQRHSTRENLLVSTTSFPFRALNRNNKRSCQVLSPHQFVS